MAMPKERPSLTRRVLELLERSRIAGRTGCLRAAGGPDDPTPTRYLCLPPPSRPLPRMLGDRLPPHRGRATDAACVLHACPSASSYHD